MAADGVTSFQPASYADWCLDRIATALELLARQRPPEESGTPLPADFPAREALAERGVIFLEALPRTGSGLAGIGLDATAISRILTWLRVNG